MENMLFFSQFKELYKQKYGKEIKNLEEAIKLIQESKELILAGKRFHTDGHIIMWSY